MRWATVTKHSTQIEHEDKVFNILCIDDAGAHCLYINGDYVADIDKLPSRDELIGFIEEFTQLNRLSRDSFSGIGLR